MASEIEGLIVEALDGIGESIDEIEMPTLRDRFAMSALTGMISYNGRICSDSRRALKMNEYPVRAYEIADAMLIARTRPAAGGGA